MPNNVFSCQRQHHQIHQKRPKKCQTMTYTPNTIFSCQTTSKRANFWNLALQCQPGNPEEMVRADPTNTHTAGIGPYHSTLFTLLLEVIICEQKWIQFQLQNSPGRVFAFDGKICTTIMIYQTCEIGPQLKFLLFSE